MESAPQYAVYALKYATRLGLRSEQFYGYHGDEPVSMDYFIWAAVSAEQTVVVDTGFTAEVAMKRGRRHLRCPIDALRAIGVDPALVQHVVLTHLHYDHTGNTAGFPAATLWLQDEEMAFWTGRYVARGQYRDWVEEEDILHLVRENFAGRIRFVDGAAEVVPGVTLHHTGGHTPGLQVVRVNTIRGHVVLASDACHFYANIDEDHPFAIVHDLPQMHRAFDVVRSLADPPSLVVPGHDPLVLRRFPAAAKGLEDIVVRIA